MARGGHQGEDGKGRKEGRKEGGREGGREGGKGHTYLARGKFVHFLSVHGNVVVLSLVGRDGIDLGGALRLVLRELEVQVALT